MVPYSKMKAAVAQILKDEGFVREVGTVGQGIERALRIHLIYADKNRPAISGLQRVSKPSLRVYAGHNEMPRVYGGLGTAILSTSKGMMTGRQAWKAHIGGEIVCVVW
jgi:small subunit ribosomal protein S8